MTARPSASWFNEFARINSLFLGLQLALVLINSSSFVSALPLPLHVYLELILTLLIQCADKAAAIY